MKKLIFLILIFPGCAGWTINGIPADRFRNMEPKEYIEVAGGVGLSFLTHWLGHVAYLEIQGADWHQDGLSEVYMSKDLTESQNRCMGRSGFVLQLFVGTGLKHTKWADSWWVTGYQIGTVAEITTYPLHFHGIGDLNTIQNHGGNSDLEYALYSVWSLWNLQVKP